MGSSGRPLDAPLRQEMEGRLGADFSDVRVHTGADAAASAAGIGARAYTSGSHVVLGPGGADKHTLAHELTHVIQQRSGPVAGRDDGGGLRISDPSDRFEREAEANATRVMRAPAPGAREARGDREATGARETVGAHAASVAGEGAVQRADLDKNNWAHAVSTNQKAAHTKPGSWGDAALHHKISKERLVGIGEALERALQNGVDEAKAFNRIFRTAVDKEIVKSNPQTVYLLWNMGVNLAVGPPSPQGDPGMLFDPDTVPDGNGGRRLDDVSAGLKALEGVWLAARDKPDGPEGEDWTAMTDHLRAAIAAHKAKGYGPDQIAAPDEEQWLAEQVTNTDGNVHTQHHRKGLRNFPGPDEGVEMFRRDRESAEDIDAYEGGTDTVATETHVEKIGERYVGLTLSVNRNAIRHICERHTLRHFDFGQAKAVNNFWAPGTGAAQVEAIVRGTLGAIVRTCFELYLKQGDLDVTMPEEVETGEVKLGNVTAGETTLFFIGSDLAGEEGTVPVTETAAPAAGGPSGKAGKTSAAKAARQAKKGGKAAPSRTTAAPAVETREVEGWSFTGMLSTIAPDGASSTTFLRSELAAIRAAL
ncbi:eCIS core domain-containing protein [Kitasatospora sp. NPDC004240]